jgi:2-hydroxychromene-2-carboxylate isomerase
MNMKLKAYFYYDIISPYAYFFLKSRKALEDKLEIIPTPIFFPGLLRLQDNRGPAEVPEKRIYTYQFCVWKAQKLKLPFEFPKRHPFASVPAQRLLLQHNADLEMLDKAFDFVWGQGHDPELEWEGFCEAIGVAKNTPKPQDENIKKALIEATQTAAKHGVFGVPSLRINQQIFWGFDSIDWALEYLNKPDMFSEEEFQKTQAIINPLLEK